MLLGEVLATVRAELHSARRTLTCQGGGLQPQLRLVARSPNFLGGLALGSTSSAPAPLPSPTGSPSAFHHGTSSLCGNPRSNQPLTSSGCAPPPPAAPLHRHYHRRRDDHRRVRRTSAVLGCSGTYRVVRTGCRELGPGQTEAHGAAEAHRGGHDVFLGRERYADVAPGSVLVRSSRRSTTSSTRSTAP